MEPYYGRAFAFIESEAATSGAPTAAIGDDGRRPGEITLEEAGRLLGVSPKRLRRLCNDNSVPSVKRFNFVFIPQEALYEWYSLPENRASIRPYQVYPVEIDIASDELPPPKFSVEAAFVSLNERVDGIEELLNRLLEK